MAYPNYVANVPYKPLAGSWSMPQPALPPLATEMDGGNLRKRRRPGDDVAIIEFRVGMTRAEYSTFDTWFRDVIFNGASRFNMSVWLGAAFSTKVVQFDGDSQPTPSEYGLDVIVPMKLRVYGM